MKEFRIPVLVRLPVRLRSDFTRFLTVGNVGGLHSLRVKVRQDIGTDNRSDCLISVRSEVQLLPGPFLFARQLQAQQWFTLLLGLVLPGCVSCDDLMVRLRVLAGNYAYGPAFG
jgi:hypothetical protein